MIRRIHVMIANFLHVGIVDKIRELWPSALKNSAEIFPSRVEVKSKQLNLLLATLNLFVFLNISFRF